MGGSVIGPGGLGIPRAMETRHDQDRCGGQDRHPRTLLVVDDQASARHLVAHALRHCCRVLEAGDRRSAIELLVREPVDLVLLDLHLPPAPASPSEGLSVHRFIREHEPGLPVVVVSGNEDPAVRQALLGSGARAFLAKPVAAEKLVAIVQQLLGC